MRKLETVFWILVSPLLVIAIVVLLTLIKLWDAGEKFDRWWKADPPRRFDRGW